jgi:hypothetical protein
MSIGPIFVDSETTLNWVFENTGKDAWPKVKLSRVHGDLDLVASVFPIDYIVLPGNKVTYSVNFKAPSKAGNFLATFRLVHGDNIEFGDKASVDFEVKAHPVVEAPLLSFDNVVEQPAMVPAEQPPVVEEKELLEEEKVSDKEIAMMRSQQMLDKFEKDDQFEKSFEIEADAVSVESNEIDIIDDEPVIQEEPSQEIQVN